MSMDNKPRMTGAERQLPIKITYLVDFFRTLNAGTERQLGHLLTGLPSDQYSIQLISLQNSRFIEQEAPRIFRNVSIKSLGAESDISNSPNAILRLYLELRRFKPQIVHTVFPTSNSIGVIIAKLAGSDIVITSRRDMGYNLEQRDILKLRIANRFVDAVVSNSLAVRDRTVAIEKVPNSKIKVIYNGIGLNGLPVRSPETGVETAVVGIVANLNRQVKRVDLFIEAAAKVHAQKPNTVFWIIGDGYLRPDYELIADKYGISNNVHFLGRRKDVTRLLPQMDVGVIC